MKHYKKGYIAGVFDLFHIGHLNLIRRAKERCDYLLVGVVSEEIPIHYKGPGKAPVISLEERMAIVEAIRYVDEVVPVTFDNLPKVKAWELYGYDAYFSGDDYADNKGWQEEGRQLAEHGVDLVFVSYTKERTSTGIRQVLDQKKNGKSEE